MKKADIIAATLEEQRKREEKLANESVDFPAYSQQIVDELERKLADIQPDIDIPTCQDFAYLEVECWPVCHIEYPEWELAIIEIESGGRDGSAARSTVPSIRPNARPWSRVLNGKSWSASSVMNQRGPRDPGPIRFGAKEPGGEQCSPAAPFG